MRWSSSREPRERTYSKMALKVAQLSDCHLPEDPRAPYREQDADANLERVWKTAREWGPDLVLLTGDLSEDASAASYDRLGRILQTRLPVLAIPGNHDDPRLVEKLFPNGPWEGPLVWDEDEWSLVLTDSTRPGSIEGHFPDDALERLSGVFSNCAAEHLLVALHHQPIPVDAPWIDKYPLAEPAGFLEVIDSEPRVRCVVWGHIHHHFAADRNGVLMLGGPSTAANSAPRAARFELDPAGPACHRLELCDDGAVAYGQLFAKSE